MKISMFKAAGIVCCCLGLLMPLGCSSQEDIQAELKTEQSESQRMSSREIDTHELASPVVEEEPYFVEQPVDELAMAPQEELTTELESPTNVGLPSGAMSQARGARQSGGQTTAPRGFAGDARAVVDSSPKPESTPLVSGEGSGKAGEQQEIVGPLGIDALVGKDAEAEKQGGGKKYNGVTTFNDQVAGLDKSKEALDEQHRIAQEAAAQQREKKRIELHNDPLGGIAQEQFSREAYDHIEEAPFQQVSDHPLSTFSIDVDTASYSNMRRFLASGHLPPAGAVRIEELINYFTYNYPEPDGDEPFGTDVEIAAAPWNEQHRLVRIGLQGKKLHPEQRPACNLVFLIDTSGSMHSQNKLPLVMQSMLLLAEQLEERDSVAIVTYAGSAGLRLPATSGAKYEEIASSIHGLSAGGSTNGAGGITLAYQIARDNLIKDGVNRVILATDGDFNVGVTNQSELTKLITDEAKSGVFLSVLGYGMGNYNDSTLEKLADQGNGNYAYIDTIKEAHKVLREQLFGTLVTIAKDVKIQIEFNPATVSAYRLIGYENRLLKKEDFNDDKKDAGEIGAGHTVTALYEVVPAGVEVPTPKVDPLKYQKEPLKLSKAAKSDELLTLKLRYKAPDGDTSKLMEIPVKDSGNAFGKSTTDFQFAAAVASFGMKLRRSETIQEMSLGGILEIAQSAVGEDESGYRGEFVELVKNSQQLLK